MMLQLMSKEKNIGKPDEKQLAGACGEDILG
ncbi:hypothetical protein C823_002798 [Eubacterium plexicaudatum ASF492]|uniref:Uncharacterized protein n=1 Tax=Eubacterium plexicaudatum ASF492 TaxID=1235802 RepID=N2AF17_9FIRM|nr:hypothetical protein C823_002798 [Eubacterium plexicaudatum ASF492]